MGGRGGGGALYSLKAVLFPGFDQKAFSIYLPWLRPVLSFEVSVEFPFFNCVSKHHVSGLGDLGWGWYFDVWTL